MIWWRCKFCAPCLVAGLRVPQDVAVLGAENLEEITLTSRPPLSSVDVPMEQLGFRAAEILHSLMEGIEPKARFPLVPPTSVITRASTDALALSDTLLARAYAFLRDNLASGIGVRDLEKHLHAGRRQIERRTREGWGCSPMEMIQRMRVAEARHLLAHTERTVDDIAQAAGFTGARALLKQFKRLGPCHALRVSRGAPGGRRSRPGVSRSSVAFRCRFSEHPERKKPHRETQKRTDATQSGIDAR